MMLRLAPLRASGVRRCVVNARQLSSPVKYEALSVGIPKETYDLERRVAASPATVALMKKAGFGEVRVEKGAGALASYSDGDYEKAGATLVSTKEALGADVVMKLRPPTDGEVSQLVDGKTLISFAYPGQNEALVASLAKKGQTLFAMDQIPRTLSRGQTYDALSSQALLRAGRFQIRPPRGDIFIISFT